MFYNYLKNIFYKMKNEIVFIIATLGAIITSIFITPKSDDINYEVLMILFNLMIVVEIFKKEKFLDYISIKFLKKYTNERIISGILLILVFFSSMLLTNDVALITFVPLTIAISKKANFSPIRLIVLETLCANIGGSFTPMGNPQNLYIFNNFHLTLIDFFKIISPFVLLGLSSIMLINNFTPNNDLLFLLKKSRIRNKTNVFIGIVIFILTIFSIFHKLNILYVTLITTIYIATRKKKKYIPKIDWFLLSTFISFFIFIGNISEIQEIKNFMHDILSNSKKIYITSIIMSQFISNVPSAILISQFTEEWKSILIGVNIGGFGTLIASLASLISYKLFINEFPEKKALYFKEFCIYNFIFLITFGFLFFYLI